jgi:hypothetical protein
MRTFSKALLAGVAAIALGVSGAAWAQNADTHVMTVRLPEGGVAQIRYTGNVAPQVSVGQAPSPIEIYAPMPALFGVGSPFAEFDRISAEMDHQAAAMLRQANALVAQARSGQLTEAAIHNLPPGSQGYTFVSTMSGSGVCTRSVEITTPGNGAPPKVVSHSSGNCGPSGGTTGTVNLPTAAPLFSQPAPIWTSAPSVVPAPATRPDVVWTSAHGARPYAGLVEPIPIGQH